MPTRPLCNVCNTRPRAVAYHKYGRVYYRSRCDACITRNRRLPRKTPRWQSSGYRKKIQCDRCGFLARHPAQLLVYHVDGDCNNTDLRNLKTVCLNCVVEITKLDLPWRRGDLEEDR
jgi:hypothetical protein